MGDVRALLGGTFNGIFTENIRIPHKSIILKGSYDNTFINQDRNNTPTTVDGQQKDRVIFHDSNGCDITIDSFIIKNGKGKSDVFGCGGGISANIYYLSSINIARNIIKDNGSGGIRISTSNDGTSCRIENNIITANPGGGIISYSNHLGFSTITNNTITGNTITGGGIFAYSDSGSTVTITNLICYGNTPSNNNLYISGTGTTTCTHSDIGDPGYLPPSSIPPIVPSAATNYNIKKAPVFINETAGDYHLEPTGNDYIINGGADGTQMGAYGGSDPGTTIGFVA